MPRRAGLGVGLMLVAGTVSGLLEIGSGALKVPAMDVATDLPIEVSTATSNRHPPPAAPGPSVGAALRDLPSLHPETLAALGVVVLVATPILQLLTSAILFWRKRDRLFLAFTLVVCTVVGLGAALAGGRG